MEPQPCLLILRYSLANKQDLPGAQSIDAIRKAFAKVLQGRNACIFKSFLTRPMATSGLPDAFEWLSIALEMESSGKPAYTPRADSVTDLCSSDSLTETLESWLDRTESTLQEFIYQFSSFTLPAWDHYTHIRITFVLLTTHGRQRGEKFTASDPTLASPYADIIKIQGKT